MTVVNGFRVLESSTEVFRFGYDNTNERLVAGNINKGDLPNVMVTLDNGNTGQVAYIKDSSGNIGWKSIEANKINNTNSTSNVTVNDSNEIRFDTNNTERIVINNSGDVNISSNLSVGGYVNISSNLSVVRPDDEMARIFVGGSVQGTGIIEVGQNPLVGGGMIYNGDNDPNVLATQDSITFFRRFNSATTMIPTAHYDVSNGTWKFHDGLSVSGNTTISSGRLGLPLVSGNGWLDFNSDPNSLTGGKGWIGFFNDSNFDDGDSMYIRPYGTGINLTLYPQGGNTRVQSTLSVSGAATFTSSLSVSGKVTVPNAALNGGTNYFWIQDKNDIEMFRIYHSSNSNYNDQIVIPRPTTKFAIGKGIATATLDVNGDANVSGTLTVDTTITSGNGLTLYDTLSSGIKVANFIIHDQLDMGNALKIGIDYRTLTNQEWKPFLIVGGRTYDNNGTLYTSNEYHRQAQFIYNHYKVGLEFIVEDSRWASGGSQDTATSSRWGTNAVAMTWKASSSDGVGLVGVNAKDPTYPLEVRGWASTTVHGGTNSGAGSSGFAAYQMYATTTNTSDPPANSSGGVNHMDPANGGAITYGVSHAGTTHFISIRAEKAIMALGFVASSDERIKQNIVSANIEDCANIVNNLPLRRYDYIDKVAHSTNTVYGYIAQEANLVLPEAVGTSYQPIPDIMEFVPPTNIELIDDKIHITLTSNISDHNLTIGDKIEIITNVENKDVSIDTIESDNTFTITVPDSNYDHEWSSNIFIRGRYVDDFMTVDKTRITTVHHGAIQYLSQENAELKVKVSILESQMSNLMTWATSQGYTI